MVSLSSRRDFLSFFFDFFEWLNLLSGLSSYLYPVPLTGVTFRGVPDSLPLLDKDLSCCSTSFSRNLENTSSSLLSGSGLLGSSPSSISPPRTRLPSALWMLELQTESSLGSFMSSSEGMPSKTKLSMWVACWESSWLTKTGSTGPEEEELAPSLSSCLRKVSSEPRQYSPSCSRLSPLPCLFRACREKVSKSENSFY